MVYHSVEAIPDSGLSACGAAKMRCRLLAFLTRKRETQGSRTDSRLTAFAFFFAIGLFAAVAATKTLPARSFQERKKASDLYWNPPQVDARMTLA